MDRLAPPTERIGALDLVRGFAVCGILLMNLPVMALPWSALGPRFPVQLNADWIAFAVQQALFEGAMRGLFTLLFGAGMLLMLQGEGGAPAFVRRCLGLMALGVVNFAVFFWPGEILWLYGVTGLVLLLFRRTTTAVLLAGALVALLGMTVLHGTDGRDLAAELRTAEAGAAAQARGETLRLEQADALAYRAERLHELNPPPERRREERLERTQLPDLFEWSFSEWRAWNLSTELIGGDLESLGAMLLGMALLRLGVLTGERSRGLYATLAIVGLGLGGAARGAVQTLAWSTGYQPDPTVALIEGWIAEPARVALTLGWLGAVLWLHASGALGRLAAVLQAIGRLALTNYMLQSAVTSLVFYGLGLFDRLSFAALLGVAVLIWLGQGAFSLLWLKRYDIGPFEAALRAFAYLRPPRLRKAAAQPAPAL